MGKLPPTLQVETLLGLALPLDLTIAEVKAHALVSPALSDLRMKMQPHLRESLRIRFVYSKTEEDVPDLMTLGEFQKLSAAKVTHIIVDDLGGGLKVRELA